MAPLTLLDLLSNEYLLLSTTPYLLPAELLSFALCSRSYLALLTHSRSVWRHLNLSASPRPLASTAATAQRAPIPLYQAEVATLLNKPFVLRDLKTLILDGLGVTVELLHDLLSSNKYRIQLLSIRECSNLNERQLMLLLQYLVRPSRADDTPSLKGCYWFGDMDAPGGIFPFAAKSRDSDAKGRFIKPAKLIDAEWVGILKACEGVIAFDTRLCSGPRHDEDLLPAVATIRLAGNCAQCGSSPEARKGMERLPLVVVPPVPLFTSDVRTACKGPQKQEEDMLRCETCVMNRWCARCGQWWCESCVSRSDENKFVSLDCYDCGYMCQACNSTTSRTCKSCRGGYCIVHNDGADNHWVRLNPPTFLVLPGQRCVCPFWSNAFADGASANMA